MFATSYKCVEMRTKWNENRVIRSSIPLAWSSTTDSDTRTPSSSLVLGTTENSPSPSWIVLRSGTWLSNSRIQFDAEGAPSKWALLRLRNLSPNCLTETVISRGKLWLGDMTIRFVQILRKQTKQNFTRWLTTNLTRVLQSHHLRPIRTFVSLVFFSINEEPNKKKHAFWRLAGFHAFERNYYLLDFVHHDRKWQMNSRRVSQNFAAHFPHVLPNRFRTSFQRNQLGMLRIVLWEARISNE